jgi:hypothetical protein
VALDNFVGGKEKNKGKRKIVFDVCNFTVCDSVWNKYHINRGMSALKFILVWFRSYKFVYDWSCISVSLSLLALAYK